ncbi:glycosyltransferase [Tepidamorphus sp. 3E244]|uniref:glycosyltransferase n=1 Tax=Tepidamorphus sp. 3E244 TaxID=3385498 RepID=UPI0038FCDBDD
MAAGEKKEQGKPEGSVTKRPEGQARPVAKPEAQKRTCLLVLGMHRSGTSALTRVLSLMGAVLPENLLGADSSNATGHWEPQKLVSLHDRMLNEAGSSWDDWRDLDLESSLSRESLDGFKAEIRRTIEEEYGDASLFVIKDPRICRFPGLYFEILAAMGVAVHPILMLRNPLAVAASLSARNEIKGAQGWLYWLRHVLDAEAASRTHRRSVVFYENLLDYWRAALGPLITASDIAWPVGAEAAMDEIDAFLSKEHRHHLFTSEEISSIPSGGQWMHRVWRAFETIRSDPAKATAELDAVNLQFTQAVDLFSEALAAERAERERAQAERAEIAAGRDEAQAEVERVKGECADKIHSLQSRHEEKLSAEIMSHSENVRSLHHAYRSSTSWRITLPLRAIRRSGRKAFRLEIPIHTLSMLTRAPLKLVDLANAVIQRIRLLGFRRAVVVAKTVLVREGVRGFLSRLIRLQDEGLNGRFLRPGPSDLLDERRRFLGLENLFNRPHAKPSVARVVILSETQLPQCHHYRVRQKIDALRSFGVEAVSCEPGDLYNSINAIQYASAVIAYRLPNHELFQLHLDEARRLGIPFGYDVDDPVFDEKTLGANASLAQLDSFIRDGQLRDAVNFRQAIRACDFCIGSTPALVDLLIDTVGLKHDKVFLWRNGVDAATLKKGRKLIERRNDNGKKIVIGYFSGSLAHNADFDVLRPSLFALMQANPSVHLLVGGYLGEIGEFQFIGDRVEQYPYLDYNHYLERVAKCDLVLIPLRDDIFNRNKSVVRFLDAAAVGKPVAASAVGDFVDIIREGETGFLVNNDQWSERLGVLLSDRKLLREVGKHARDYVETNFSADLMCGNLDATLLRHFGAVNCAS